MDYANKAKKSCLLFEVDFEKACDNVCWDYLWQIMRHMGFRNPWLTWMKAIVFRSWMSSLVNGSATKELEVSKGLRQGDPLLPFCLSLLAKACHVWLIKHRLMVSSKAFWWGRTML